MAKIPLGDFGNVVAKPPPKVNVPAGAFDKGRGLQQLGEAIAGIGASAQQQGADLKRAQAANYVLDREIAAKTIQQGIEQDLAAGKLSHQEAPARYQEQVKSLPAPELPGLDPVAQENLARGVKRIDFNGQSGVADAAFKAMADDYRGQTDLALDKLGKLAGLPGADAGQIGQRVHSLDPLGQVAYGKQWPKLKQEFTDKLWYNQAAQQVMGAKDNLEGLKALETELANDQGRFAGKLDTDKRTLLLRSVQTGRQQLEDRAQHAADRQEARAKQALEGMDRQIASGVPATPEMWQAWAGQVEGTAHWEGFRARIAAEAETQQVLRLPPAEQSAFVQQKEALLMSRGGPVQEKARLDQLKKAVETNITTLHETPLLYTQQRGGEAVQPLDIGALLTPEGAAAAKAAIGERVNAIRALQQRHGTEVRMAPLLPQEVSLVGLLLKQSASRDQAQVLGALRQGFATDRDYLGALRQVAKDAPLKALAGAISLKAPETAALLLKGEAVLAGKEEGVAQFPVPEEKKFRQELDAHLGDLFKSQPNAYGVALQAVRAHYAGLTVEKGDITGEIDTRRVKESIAAVLGEPVDFRGNGRVLPPFGMPADVFRDRADRALRDEIQERGLALGDGQRAALGLQPSADGDGGYSVINGRNFLYDKSGSPVVIWVRP